MQMQTSFDNGKPHFGWGKGGVDEFTMGGMFFQDFQRDGFFILQVFVLNSTADWAGCRARSPVFKKKKIAFVSEIIRMQQKPSFTKSLIYLNVSRTLCAFPSVSVDTVLGLRVSSCVERRALTVLCVCLHCPCSPRVHWDARGWGAGAQRGEQADVYACPCTDAVTRHRVSPTSPRCWEGITTRHLPERALEALGVGYSFSFVEPSRKSELNMLKCHCLIRCP